MATAQSIDIKTEFTELSETAMEAFCRDITGMFDVEMVCKQQEGCTETVAGLKKRFKKITAVVTATAKGHLAGSFHLIFDQDGLFTLAGVIVMQPKQIIIENKRRGTLTEVENVRDAIKEGGNLLVGSWNRVCLEKWGSKTHLLQTDTFIGNPWTNSQESIHVAENEEFLYIPCEMTIADYPVFNYGILFPKTITDSILHPDTETSDSANKEQPKVSPPVSQAATSEKPVPVEPVAVPVEAKPVEVKVETKAAAVEPVAVPVEAKPVEVKVETKAAAAQSAEPKTESVPATESKEKLPPTESPVPVKLSATASSDSQEGPEILWTLCAKDIMRRNVIWCQSDESVEQVRVKMDQNDVGYVIAGTEGMMEGIISRSDLAAALSPYLRPMFAQWRRPLDEASLQIKVKWIMSRPVQIVKPDKPLAIVMEKMCRHNIRALPVVDQHGKVEGLITVFDIFKMLLQKNQEVPFAVKTA
jgi:CBS domain-containing protein